MSSAFSFLLFLVSIGMISSAPRKLIIDTDGGADDVMAIISAIRFGRDVEVVGITTGCGNANSSQSAINVLKTLKVLDRMDIPVYRGSESFYTTSKDLSSDYFGKDSLGDFVFENPPTLEQINPEHGVMALIRLAKQHEGELSILCLGPVTNIAHAVKLDPTFLKNLNQIIVMGGTLTGNGNDSPGTEFNFRRDPEATRVLFEYSSSEKPVFLLPRDTVEELKISMNWRKNILGTLETPLMDFMNKAEKKILERNTIHWSSADTVAAFVFLQPEHIESMTSKSVLILTEGEISRGLSLVNHLSDTFNTMVVTKVNKSMLKRMLVSSFDKENGNHESDNLKLQQIDS